MRVGFGFSPRRRRCGGQEECGIICGEGSVLWKPPYRVDITEALAGAQRTARPTVELAVKVTNLWPNRLIGDDALPADVEWLSPEGKYQPIKEIPQWVKDGQKSPTGRHTFTTWRFWKADDPLLPSGLLGSVRILRVAQGRRHERETAGEM